MGVPGKLGEEAPLLQAVRRSILPHMVTVNIKLSMRWYAKSTIPFTGTNPSSRLQAGLTGAFRGWLLRLTHLHVVRSTY
jgi:hypothetical protein